MIRGVFIFQTTGLTIFHTSLDPNSPEEVDDTIFAGISSAIVAFIKEMGHSNLRSVDTQNGMLIYSVSRDIIFVVNSVSKKGTLIGNFLVKQMEREFLEEFGSLIDTPNWDFIDRSHFIPFSKNIHIIYDHLLKLYENHRDLLDFLPTTVPLNIYEEILLETSNLLEGFPHDTIRLIRRLDKKYDDFIRHQILIALGRYFGDKIAERRLKKKIGITPAEVLKLLNAISIAHYDSKKKQFRITICPICRGKKSDKPICHFFSGFIEGCFDNPKLHVNEISCRATGEKSCIFQVDIY